MNGEPAYTSNIRPPKINKQQTFPKHPNRIFQDLSLDSRFGNCRLNQLISRLVISQAVVSIGNVYLLWLEGLQELSDLLNCLLAHLLRQRWQGAVRQVEKVCF